jgi:hypothetical protein
LINEDNAVSTGSGSDRALNSIESRVSQINYPVATAPGTDHHPNPSWAQTGSGVLTFVGLHELAVDEHSVLLGPHSREKQFSLLLNGNLVLLFCPDGKFIPLGEFEREHTKVFHQRLAVNPDLEVAHKLIEREVDLMLLVYADKKAELHGTRPKPHEKNLVGFDPTGLAT